MTKSPRNGHEVFGGRGFDEDALAGLVAMSQAHDEGERAADAARGITGDAAGASGGVFIRIGAEEGVAGEGFHVVAPRAVVLVGAFDAECGHPHHDEARVDGG